LPLILESSYSTKINLAFSELRKVEPATVIKRSFRTRIHLEASIWASICVWQKTFKNKLSMCEDKRLYRLLGLMHLLTMLILAFKTALKNQRAQSVVFCSNLKILSPKSRVNIHLRNPRNSGCSVSRSI